MHKKKLTIEQQIDYMESKGIKFNLLSKEEAKLFISDNTYYFKIKAYAKNYDKNAKNRYVNLEFAYLKELSIIDMHLRRLLLQMCLQIEHFIKVYINNKLSEIATEDGYIIINNYRIYRQGEKKYHGKVDDILEAKSKYNEDLINKYSIEDFAYWNFLEILSFGSLCDFYQFFFRTHANDLHDRNVSSLLFCVKQLRNACAHNNCLINDLSKKVSQKNYLVGTITSKSNISKPSRDRQLTKLLVNDIVAVMYSFAFFVKSEAVKSKINEEIDLFLNRVQRNKAYFCKNSLINSFFAFFEKLVDFFRTISIY